MTEEIEMEKKYLIRGKKPETDEGLYQRIRREVRALDQIKEYSIPSFKEKVRQYRYFDTFDTKLTQSEVLAYVGPLEEKGVSTSVRERERDYILTVKFPKSDMADEREEWETPIPRGIEFDKVNPNDYANWPPLQQAIQYGGNNPLMDIIRLTVTSHRFDLEQEKEPKVQVALDAVKVTNPFVERWFYELEVEKLEGGEPVNVEEICAFFNDKYKGNLIFSPNPKWIKAHSLLRGEEIG